MTGIENKDDVSDELDKLAYLLNEAEICDDTSPLSQASGYCRTNSNAEIYAYRVNKLVFNLDYAPGGSVPYGKNLEDVKAILTIDLKGKYISNFNDIFNPFFKLILNVELECSDDDDARYLSAWHLDKNEEGGEQPKFHHPEYHFAFGGKNMPDKCNFGNLFVPPSPRICHPPMEAILGVDFILRNFYEASKNKRLFSNTTYVELIKKAQYRFWRPFSIAFASKWVKFDDITIRNDFVPSIIYPELF